VVERLPASLSRRSRQVELVTQRNDVYKHNAATALWNIRTTRKPEAFKFIRLLYVNFRKKCGICLPFNLLYIPSCITGTDPLCVRLSLPYLDTAHFLKALSIMPITRETSVKIVKTTWPPISELVKRCNFYPLNLGPRGAPVPYSFLPARVVLIKIALPFMFQKKSCGVLFQCPEKNE